MKPKTVVPIVSGGLDSVTLLYWLDYMGYNVNTVVSFNYGQRHMKELLYAEKAAKYFRAKHVVIDLWSSGLPEALAGSGTSLLKDSSTEVPEGHYAEENMKATVVPNRNMIMLSIAGAIAVAEGANHVATGVHAGDHFIYPDCRPSFIAAAGIALDEGNKGFGDLEPDTPILAPFLGRSKADIAHWALKLGVPLHETWSCYKGGDIHCGKCGTCVERLEAIDEAIRRPGTGYVRGDRTEYEDKHYWKTVVKK